LLALKQRFFSFPPNISILLLNKNFRTRLPSFPSSNLAKFWEIRSEVLFQGQKQELQSIFWWFYDLSENYHLSKKNSIIIQLFLLTLNSHEKGTVTIIQSQNDER
jgi:hypothetical protein